ncbi:hypothetical protein Q8A67_018283 [Cirrhinus molitorella]|uniref:Uncharacterized protein n=1 Tax=Cirrhinus molitorella TaxID=172907 RepID=A0AA88PBS8_9TELE|nr:hypothetical protein Q8A67_018283 [Cirrhinus molitorella]
MAELGRVPGQLLTNSSEVRERGQERGRRGWAAAAVVLEPVSQPLLCPLSPSPHWLLRGHTPWPGPRNQGVRTRAGGPLSVCASLLRCFMGCVLRCADLALTPVPPSQCRTQAPLAPAKIPQRHICYP